MGSKDETGKERVSKFNTMTGRSSKPTPLEASFLADVPDAKYSRVSEFFRRVTSGDNQCKFFCGGKRCKYENGETHWSKEDMAINGLYSTWITDRILAMARPNTHNILKYDMIGQFKRCGIKTVINLQMPGEHAHCGQGLVEGVGFSYDPQLFMDNGIFHYNFGWDDFGVASVATLLDMVRVFKFAAGEGKVAVHCHAGLGRTGVLITCFLVYTWRVSGNRAIQQMRLNRPQAVQTRQQMSCVRSFAAFLRPLQVIFPHQHFFSYEFTLTQFLRRQRHLLHGLEARYLHYVPKPLFIFGERLLGLAGCRRRSLLTERPSPLQIQYLIPRAFQESRNSHRVPKLREEDDEDDEIEDDVETSMNRDLLTSRGFDGVVALNNVRRDTLNSNESSDEPRRAPSAIFEANNEFRHLGSAQNIASPSPEPALQTLLPIVTEVTALEVNSQSSDAKSFRDSRGDRRLPSRPSPEPLLEGPSLRPANASTNASPSESSSSTSWQEVSDALVEMGCEVRKLERRGSWRRDLEANVTSRMSKVRDWARKINDSDEAWAELENENDINVLSGLLWSWIDQLKEPVLTRQDIHRVVTSSSQPVERIMKKLTRGTRETLKHLVKICAFLETGRSNPGAEDRRPSEIPLERLRLLFHLTEQLCQQDLVLPIKDFIKEAKFMSSVGGTGASGTFSFSSSSYWHSPGADKRRRGDTSLDSSGAVVVVVFVYRVFVDVSRNQDLITDFDDDDLDAFERVVERLLTLVATMEPD